MIQKKICMLGTFGVGKTSLVRRFVQSVFSEKYHTTVGVKVDKKVLTVEDKDLTLVLWDIQGEEDPGNVRPSYLKGASGYLLVVDGTRRSSLYTALAFQNTALQVIGDVPFVFAINKTDLTDKWDLERREVDALTLQGRKVIMTSAKNGSGVEECFLTLAREVL